MTWWIRREEHRGEKTTRMGMKVDGREKMNGCFILLFNLFHSSTTDFPVTGSGILIMCNVQLIMLERFSAILAIY